MKNLKKSSRKLCFAIMSLCLFAISLQAQQNGLPSKVQVELGALPSFGVYDGIFNRQVSSTIAPNYDCECWVREDSQYALGKMSGSWYVFENPGCPVIGATIPCKYGLVSSKPGCDPTLIQGIHEMQNYQTPKLLTVYYGYPSLVNGSTTIAQAVDVFNDYHMVVFGGAIADGDHEDEQNTRSIIQNLGVATKVFGYVDLGVTTLNHNETELKRRIDLWKDMGADGIFLDDAGLDFGVDRQRLNWALDYIHNNANLVAFVNAHNPDDVFGGGNHTVKMLPSDWYLIESFQIIEGEYYSSSGLTLLHDKYKKVLRYSKKYGTNVATLTTSLANSDYSNAKIDYTWWSTAAYGFGAMGWGEPVFSANSSLPRRVRPSPSPAPVNFNSFDPEVNAGNTEIERVMTNGIIKINTTSHTTIFP